MADFPTVTIYDAIGRKNQSTRCADPRIAAAISSALGDVRSVINVGAGTGSYETLQTVVAVEPSRVMIGQRPANSAPVVQANAESLPLPDMSVDAALAVLTVHHWSDVSAGVTEMRRVARRRLVFFTWRPERLAAFWLLREYFRAAAEADASQAVPLEVVTNLLPDAKTTVCSVPIPYDCLDGFLAAYWRRPQAYLDPSVRSGMSIFAKLSPDAVQPGLATLKADIRTRRWHDRHAALLTQDALDVGYCTVTIDL